MSSQDPTPSLSSLEKHSPVLSDLAALDNFVRLQQSQAEYLAWLENKERKTDLDGYIYRQIR